MEFLKARNNFGVGETKEIPCLTGKGAPAMSTAGGVGCLYMDADTGDVYKCTAVSGTTYTWVALVQNNITVTDEQIAAAVEKYLTENPVDGVTDQQVYDAVAAYLAKNPVDGVTDELIARAVENYMAEHGADSGQNGNYTLPVATAETLGGVKPVAKSDAMTQEVGVDKNGGLWTAPDSGTGTGEIPDGSVTPEKTTFMETEGLEEGVVNVYNAEDTQWGYYSADGTTLKTVSDTKYGWSGFMQIQPNCDISISPKIANGLSKNVFYYDEDKNLLGYVVAYGAAQIDPIVVTDENAKYIRFNVDGYYETKVNTLLPVRDKYVLDPDYLPDDTMRKSQHIDVSKEKWRGKKITVDGDSITDSLYKPWWSYINEWFSLSEVQNCAASGKTIIEDRGDGRTCLERVEQDYAADTNAIFLMGAGNSGTFAPGNEDDTFEDGSFYGKMNGLIDKLQELFPLIPIVLIATPPRMNQSNLFNQYEQLKAIAANKRIYFIDCFHGTLNPDNADCRAAYIPDGVHPNDMGNMIIAQMIYEEMKRIGIAFE